MDSAVLTILQIRLGGCLHFTAGFRWNTRSLSAAPLGEQAKFQNSLLTCKNAHIAKDKSPRLMEKKLELRIARLKKHVSMVSGELTLALNYTSVDPKSSLTKSRLILEKILSDIYLKVMGKMPPHTMIGPVIPVMDWVGPLTK